MKIPEEMSEAEFLLGIIKSANDVSPINFIMLLYAKFDIYIYNKSIFGNKEYDLFEFL